MNKSAGVGSGAMEFVALPYSPWSEKARWALDHHGVAYREREFTPLFSVPGLRWRTGLRGKITAPLLIHGGRVIHDSFDIAAFADERGSREKLMPAGVAEPIADWNRESEKALGAGRALLIHRLFQDSDAKREFLPRVIPRFLKPILAKPLTAFGKHYFHRKYQLARRSLEENEQIFEGVLRRLHAALEENYLLGTFSYADIAMAVVLQLVVPVDDRYIRLGPHGRRVWTTPKWAQTFPELIEWRDRLYSQHR